MSADASAIPSAGVTAAPGPVNPFPQETQEQQQPSAVWNPWVGTPKPRWYSGLGFTEDTAYMGPFFRALEGAGQGAAKGEALLGGVMHQLMRGAAAESYGYDQTNVNRLEIPKSDVLSETIAADARERVKALTPDATTTGAAAQLIHGLSSGLYRYTVGALAGGPLAGAGLVGSSEATNRYQELTEAGVTPGAAATSAAVTGGFATAGALLPAGLGSTLITKILSGAAGNAGFGFVSRYADHKVLELAGYQEMADQQKVWDSTAVIADLLLGGGFGTVAHLMHAKGQTPEETQAQIRDLETKLGRGVPGAEDAALTANLAMRDRAAGPGVAVDPQAANAHQAAMETATADLLQGKPVNVAGTGVERATFAARPLEDRTNVQTLFTNALHEAGILDEERNLRDLEAALGARLRGEKPAEAPITMYHGGEITDEGGKERWYTKSLEDARGWANGGPIYSVDVPSSHPNYERLRGDIANGVAPDSRMQLAADLDAQRRQLSAASRETAATQGKAAQFLHDFELAHEESATHPGERIVNGNVHIEAIADPTDPSTVHINGVRAVRPGQGSGTQALEHLTALADQHDVRLTLDAKPLDRAGIGQEKLSEWYQRFGFAPTGGAEMVREAKGAESVQSGAAGSQERYTVQEEPLTDEQLRVFQGLRSQLRTEQELGGSRGGESGQPGTANASEPGQGANRRGEPLRVFRGAERELSAGDYDPGVLGRASGHPSSGLGVFFSLSKAEASRYGSVTEHYLDIRNPKIIRAEDLPGFDSVEEAHAFREKLRAQGYDGIVIDGSHLGGPVNYVSFEPHQAIPTGEAKAAPKVDPLADPAHQTVQENPNLEIPDSDGNLVNAGQALGDADHAVSDAERDSKKAILAAINCFQRRGGG